MSKYDPLAYVAGFDPYALQEAEADSISRDEASALLAQLRAGNLTCKAALLDGLRHLVYQWTKTKAGRYQPQLWGALYQAMVKAIDGIVKPRHDDKTDIYQFVEGRLWSTRKKFYAQEFEKQYAEGDALSKYSQSINVPDSTKRRRKKEGKKPHKDLKRSREIKTRDGYADPLNDPATLIDAAQIYTNQRGDAPSFLQAASGDTGKSDAKIDATEILERQSPLGRRAGTFPR